MLLRRFYDEDLAQASYLVACQTTRVAIVVDPARDPAPYLAAAAADGVRITYVTETHIHADFVSGARELSRRSAALLLLSGEGGEDWQYRYADSDGARLLHGGDRLDVGRLRFDVMHTPGHTPEHLAFVVTEPDRSPAPIGMLSGDFLFAGDVGRPDLLERSAGAEGTAELAARQLYRSLRSIATLPDHLQVWPGHGAGSACGKSLGAVPQTTLGYERLAGWAFAAQAEDTFVRSVLTGQPAPPTYFTRMKRVNRDGPPPLGSRAALARLDGASVARAAADGGWVIDVRPSAAYVAAHVARSLALPATREVLTWGGWLLPYETPLYLVADDAQQARAASDALARIGFDDVAGFAPADEALAAAADVRSTREVTPDTAADSGARLLDVRNRDEWRAAHIPGVASTPLGRLATDAADLPRDEPVIAHCQGGSRSLVAASVLERMGFADVAHVRGGFRAWAGVGLPTAVEPPEPPMTLRTGRGRDPYARAAR